MKRELCWFIGLSVGVVIALPGCLLKKPDCTFDEELAHCETVATEIEYPDLCQPACDPAADLPAPHTMAELSQVEYWPMTLQDAIHLALTNSRVMRDLGGTVLRSPESVQTTYAPSIQETDPLFGVDAALSAFDTEFSSSLLFDRNDRRLNNQFLGNLGDFQQDTDAIVTQLSKRAATGSQFTVRKQIDYDDDNALGNMFHNGIWNVHVEGEFRHPLLQGSGVQFNRIAGPGGSPGILNGVLIARVKTDVSLADFELGVRDFVSNVENAYWDLYFAYRDLDVKIRARNTGLDTWRKIHALYLTGRRGGEAEKEAQARVQYFRFEEEVQNALTGRLLEGTRTNNGTTPGTFRGFPGVYVNERRLRLLTGLPPNGERLIRPADEPPTSPVAFDWSEVATEAIARRAELRRQKWIARRREMELIASRNFLKPNLDLVGRYRWRGFGEDLLNSDRSGLTRFDNAFMNLTSGDYQEWHMGVEFSLPIGFRQAHAGVRNAELRLARANVVLREQERQVLHDLSNAVAELDRAYQVVQTNFNAKLAAKQELDAVQAAYLDDKTDFFVVLDTQRRYADAESRYFQSQVEYALALRNVHFEKGSLLDYCGVVLSEGTWPSKAYADAARRNCLRRGYRQINYCFDGPPLVSQGPYPQRTLPAPAVRDQGGSSPFIEEPLGSGRPVPPSPGVQAEPNVMPEEPTTPLPAQPPPPLGPEPQAPQEPLPAEIPAEMPAEPPVSRNQPLSPHYGFEVSGRFDPRW